MCMHDACSHANQLHELIADERGIFKTKYIYVNSPSPICSYIIRLLGSII